MVSIKIFIEGSGKGKEQAKRFRAGFRKLFEKTSLKGKLPACIPGKGRVQTFEDFLYAFETRKPDEIIILWVDSEGIPETFSSDPDSGYAWQHLQKQDKWKRPADAKGYQAQLMITCMETLFLADRAALKKFFGPKLSENRLLSDTDNRLEKRSSKDVQTSLYKATEPCGRSKCYQKGPVSFMLVGELNPEALQSKLPAFKRLISSLEKLSQF